MLEIEAVGTIDYVHIFDKYQGDYAKQHGIEAAYQLRLTIPKNGVTHQQIVEEAKNLGVSPSSASLRYTDSKDGWQINLTSRYPITIGDRTGKTVEAATEPGNGTLANVAFRIGSTRDHSKLVYFLTGVQLVKVSENDWAPHTFNVFEEEPEF